MSSEPELAEALLVCQGLYSHSYLFSLFNVWPTKCLCFLGATKLLSSSNVEDAIRKWLLHEAIAMIARNREFEVVRYFRSFAP